MKLTIIRVMILHVAFKIINQYIANDVKQKVEYDPNNGNHSAIIEKYAVTEDYKILLRILERARAFGILNGAEEDSKVAFKMDANGNLERIIK